MWAHGDADGVHSDHFDTEKWEMAEVSPGREGVSAMQSDRGVGQRQSLRWRTLLD